MYYIPSICKVKSLRFQFGMGDTSVTMGNGMGPGPMGASNAAGPEGGPLTGLLNGEELKQSPASTPRGGVNGGTPAPPGSAHSMHPASVPGVHGGTDLMDQQSSKVCIFFFLCLTFFERQEAIFVKH